MATLLNMFYLILLFSPLPVFGAGGFFNFAFGLQKYCFCRCGYARHVTDSARTGRLLGGESTVPHQFPWLASITAGAQIVGGSLISDRHVVTAASPLYGLSAGNVTVTLGAHDRCGEGDPALVNSVASIALHPGYSPTNTDNDIALVKLRHIVSFSDFVSPVCLPFYGTRESGRVAWTVSWAEYTGNSTCTPRVATLPILSKRSCLAADDSSLFTRDKGCLGPVGSKSIICKVLISLTNIINAKGDVGAPVMSRWVSGAPFRLVGVISSGLCNQRNTPLYTRILEHADWIYSHLRNDCQCF